MVALGRNRAVLDALAELDPARVVPLALDEHADLAAAIRDLTGSTDALLDTMGPTGETGPTMASLEALKMGGSAAFVGNVTATLPIPYSLLLDQQLTLIGSNWFTRDDALDLIVLIGRGTLDLSAIKPKVFSLDRVNDAIATAAMGRLRLDHVAVTFA